MKRWTAWVIAVGVLVPLLVALIGASVQRTADFSERMDALRDAVRGLVDKVEIIDRSRSMQQLTTCWHYEIAPGILGTKTVQTTQAQGESETEHEARHDDAVARGHKKYPPVETPNKVK